MGANLGIRMDLFSDYVRARVRAGNRATHHRLLREGAYTSTFAVRELWDLERVSPLFNVPACVVLVAAMAPRPRDPIPGRAFAGRLPRKDAPWAEATLHLTVDDCEYRLRFLGERSAWIRVGDEGDILGTLGPTRDGNAYEDAFRQGAILYPQTLIPKLELARLHGLLHILDGATKVSGGRHAGSWPRGPAGRSWPWNTSPARRPTTTILFGEGAIC